MEPIHAKLLIIRRFAETDLADVLAYQTHSQTFRYLVIEPMTEDKAAAFLNGVRRDNYLYALLRGEWLMQQPQAEC